MSKENYSLQKPGKFVDRLAENKRKKMFELFIKEFPVHSHQTVLDAGVTADEKALSSNFFEKYYPLKNKILALSDQNAVHLEKIYPGLNFHQGDIRQLPFENDTIDVIFSSAVMEHLGSQTQQKKMLAECFRVARKGIFITTPNRWHPMEVHTLLPFIHWLPKNWHRWLLGKLGLDFYAREENLNLLDRGTLNRFCAELNIKDYFIKTIHTFGFVSNLILIIKKGEA